jgi:hypothetical protein
LKAPQQKCRFHDISSQVEGDSHQETWMLSAEERPVDTAKTNAAGSGKTARGSTDCLQDVNRVCVVISQRGALTIGRPRGGLEWRVGVGGMDRLTIDEDDEGGEAGHVGGLHQRLGSEAVQAEAHHPSCQH